MSEELVKTKKKKLTRSQQEAKTLERRAQVAHLYLNRVTETEIARQLGVSQGVVSTDLKRLKEEWHRQAGEDVAAMKSKQAAEIEMLIHDLAIRCAQKFDYRLILARVKLMERQAKLFGLDAQPDTPIVQFNQYNMGKPPDEDKKRERLAGILLASLQRANIPVPQHLLSPAPEADAADGEVIDVIPESADESDPGNTGVSEPAES